MGVEEIEVTISPDGDVAIHVKGVTGQKCLATTADLEAALGGEVTDRQLTQEAYQTESVDQQEWNRTSW